MNTFNPSRQYNKIHYEVKVEHESHNAQDLEDITLTSAFDQDTFYSNREDT
jgi:hypothetical protein